MEVILIIGVTLVLCIGMIILCAFFSGKSKNFIDKISGNDKNQKN